MRNWLKWFAVFACVVVAAGWIISLKWYVCAGWGDYLCLEDGQIAAWRVYDPDGSGTAFWTSAKKGEYAYVNRTYGFAPVNYIEWVGMGDRSLWSVPLWLILLPWAILAILLFRRRRLPAHCCQSCGYNLTGSVSGICPECGKPVLDGQKGIAKGQ